MPAPFPAPFPALYLYPLNDSFIPKHISLLHNARVKIGRQTNAKTSPGERNGYFDSKVLSRQHAEVWEESGKIFIKDVKSSNGTFINGERLSAEGVESEPYELKSDDIVEFGIDIVGEDTKTIIHHKVAARVVCIFTEQDVQMAARAEQHQLQQLQQYAPGASLASPNSSNSPLVGQPGPSSGGAASGSSFNFAPNPQRRPQMPHSAMHGMGGMGGSMRPPGKSGLTFDHILTRLQGELQKSRETGSELSTLTGAMHEIHDTLGGGLPPALPPYPSTLPPVRPSQPPAPQQSDVSALAGSHESEAATNSIASSGPTNSSLLSELQAQLQDTQASLAAHVEKIHSLESSLKDTEGLHQDVRVLREMMDVLRRRHEAEEDQADDIRGGFDEDDELAHDDDDMMSIATAVPHELERVEEEDEEQLAASDMQEVHLNGVVDEPASLREEELELEAEDEERRRRREELGRPRTPEPTGLGMRDTELFDSRPRSKTLIARTPASPRHHSNGVNNTVVDELTSRLASLTSQLETALEISSNLQAQHTSAQSTISTLESKIEALEALVNNALTKRQVDEEAVRAHKSIPEAEPRESITAMVNEWKKSVEGQWTSVQEEWTHERERLSRVREEWESKVRTVDTGLERLEKLHRAQTTNELRFLNGQAEGGPHHGLVTPPSPRSLSSDSNRPRKRRSSSGRGRSSSKKRSLSTDPGTLMSDALKKVLPSRPLSPEKERSGAQSLATPDASIRTLPPSFTLPDAAPELGLEHVKKSAEDTVQPIHMQTAFGVLVLGVAAAAVIWRVKPE